MAERNIVEIAPSDIRPRSTNPRTHTKKQIRQIADSIKRFGFTNPVLVDRSGGIVAGHGRVEAAKHLGLATVPIIRLEDLSEAEIRAYVIADNRLAELAGWDRRTLAIELQGLTDLDLDFDITITGFETAEIDILIDELGVDAEADPADDIPEPDGDPPVTRPGDLWLIGDHRLLCGDALASESYETLLEGSQAQVVFTDPPYNVPIDGHVCGLGQVRHREFAMASGEMSRAQFTEFLSTVFANLAKASQDGSIHYVCMDWRHMGETLAAGESAYSELKNLCVWTKTNGGMGSFYRSQHELVFVFKAGSGNHINNVDLGRYGRYRTNVWSYPGVNSFGGSREDLALHPTVKPVALVADAIRDSSRRKGIVLDAFAGAGTTLVAAQRTGRWGYGLEIDPAYCDVVVKRIKETCGLKATLATTGKTFEAVAADRQVPREDARTNVSDEVVA